MNKHFLKNSSQEQATASWINYLNQVRLDTLMRDLAVQDKNFINATSTIDDTLNIIHKQIITTNRGGTKGMHGFIAEVAEVGIENAHRQIIGKHANCQWVNDNGPIDLMRDSTPIQQKFVNNGGHLSLQAIKQHASIYPDYLKQGGKYQVPKNHYQKIIHYLKISQEDAYKMPTETGDFSLKQWKEVNDFFRQSEINLSDIEPAQIEYREVQMNTIDQTMEKEKDALKETDENIRREAHIKHQPTLNEALKVTAVSSAVEGGTTLCIEIISRIKSGKSISEFDSEDWNNICTKTGIGLAKGGIRGASVYALTNFTATPAAAANAIVTASMGIAEQAYLLKSGRISSDEFIHNSEMLCVDTTVSALSSFAGQLIIPIPIIGAVIGNSIGTMMYQIATNYLSGSEQKILIRYLEEIREHKHQLDIEYREAVTKLNNDFNIFCSILNEAFSPDYEEAFNGSIHLCKHVGVKWEYILKTKSDIDNYFLGT